MATEQEQLDVLKSEMIAVKIDVAVAKSDINMVKGKLDKIDTNISKLTWIVVGAVVLAILNSVLKGGVL